MVIKIPVEEADTTVNVMKKSAPIQKTNITEIKKMPVESADATIDVMKKSAQIQETFLWQEVIIC